MVVTQGATTQNRKNKTKHTLSLSPTSLLQVGGSKKCGLKSFNPLSNIEKFWPSEMKLSSYFHVWKNDL
jgi:hypothetical protein